MGFKGNLKAKVMTVHRRGQGVRIVTFLGGLPKTDPENMR